MEETRATKTVTVAFVMKDGDDDYTVWYPGNVEKDADLQRFYENHQNDGYSLRGTKQDVIWDMIEKI